MFTDIYQYGTLNPVQISVKSNTILASLSRYKNCKYCFLVDNLLFSTSCTNDTNVIIILCTGLNDAKKSLINGKIYKTIWCDKFKSENNLILVSYTFYLCIMHFTVNQ